ncbi:MAG TPA: hypothetical protein VGJ37_02210 [Pyrinomonadaceae bacterium]|jgi:hypothetical protein
MKKVLSITVTGCLLALMVAFTVQAQEPGTAMRASIPFEFTVDRRTLPAGNYEIRRISDDPMTLIIRNVDVKRDEAVFSTEPVIENRTPGKSVIVFHRYGDTTFLSEVVTAGEETARESIPSRAERRLRRELASNNGQPETVALAVY